MSVGRSVTFLNPERFLHYCSCQTVHDWIAVYLALLKYKLIKECFTDNGYWLLWKHISMFSCKNIKYQLREKRTVGQPGKKSNQKKNKAGYTAIQSRTVGQEQ